MSTTTLVLVEVTEAAAQKMIEVLAQAGQLRVIDEPTPQQAQACAVCGDVRDPAYMPVHTGLGQICPICQTTADRLEHQFREAARKAYSEFRSQLAQMIRDVRAGAPDPTFYRGFE